MRVLKNGKLSKFFNSPPTKKGYTAMIEKIKEKLKNEYLYIEGKTQISLSFRWEEIEKTLGREASCKPEAVKIFHKEKLALTIWVQKKGPWDEEFILPKMIESEILPEWKLVRMDFLVEGVIFTFSLSS